MSHDGVWLLAARRRRRHAAQRAAAGLHAEGAALSRPYQAWGYGEKLRARGLRNTAAGLPTAALPDEILLEGEGRVRALFCLGGNPMLAFPDQRRTEAALRRLDLLVTFDPELSATARLAHYVIAPRLTLETPGMTQAAELLKYFGASSGFGPPYAQYAPAVLSPPAGSDLIEEWEFFYELARRLGLPLQLVGFYGWGRHVESPPRGRPARHGAAAHARTSSTRCSPPARACRSTR